MRRWRGFLLPTGRRHHVTARTTLAPQIYSVKISRAKALARFSHSESGHRLIATQHADTQKLTARAALESSRTASKSPDSRTNFGMYRLGCSELKINLCSIQVPAAELCFCAGKFRCFFGEEVQNSLFRIHMLKKQLLDGRTASV